MKRKYLVTVAVLIGVLVVGFVWAKSLGGETAQSEGTAREASSSTERSDAELIAGVLTRVGAQTRAILAIENVCAAGTGAVGVVERRAGDDIAEPVIIDIAGKSHGVAEAIARR